MEASPLALRGRGGHGLKSLCHFGQVTYGIELWCPCLLNAANTVCLVNCHGDRLGNAESIQPSSWQMSSTNSWQLWMVYHHHHPGSYPSSAALHRTPSSLTAPSDSRGCLQVASGPGSLHFFVSASIGSWVQIIIPSLLMLDWGAAVYCHLQKFLWKVRWISSPGSCCPRCHCGSSEHGQSRGPGVLAQTRHTTGLWQDASYRCENLHPSVRHSKQVQFSRLIESKAMRFNDQNHPPPRKIY